MRAAIIQAAPWDPWRNPAALEALMTALTAATAEHHHVTLYAPDRTHERWRNPGENFDRITIPAEDLAAYIGSLDVDVVSVHNIPGAVTSVQGPLSIGIHGQLKPATGWPGRLAGHESPLDLDWQTTLRTLERADRLMAPSAHTAGHLNFLNRPVDVVHPMVNTAYRTTPRADNGTTVAWIGRLGRSKGLGFLAEHADNWSFPWAWSGHDYYGDLDPATLHGLPPRLPTYVGVEQMRHFYATTSVVLCPYLNEGFGMVAAEAAAAGCRVVGFDDAGLREIGGVNNVTLVPPNDAAAFDTAVTTALAAGPVSEEERETAFTRFAPYVTAARYVTHLELTVQQRQRENAAQQPQPLSPLLQPER